MRGVTPLLPFLLLAPSCFALRWTVVPQRGATCARPYRGATCARPYRCALPPRLAEEEIFADDEELANVPETNCEGRIVTELVDISAGEKLKLPDRFMFAVSAIRGDYSTLPPEMDTEVAEDSITSALLQFPAAVTMKVVSTSLPDDQADALVRDIELLAESVEAGEAQVRAITRGQRRSIEFSLSAVPDVRALSTLRAALKADERVQMVF